MGLACWILLFLIVVKQATFLVFLLEGFNATFKVLCLDFNLHFLGFTLTVCFCSFEKKHFKLYERRISNLGR
jgi:hypothetical protein